MMTRLPTESKRVLRNLAVFFFVAVGSAQAGTASLDALPEAAPAGGEIIVRGTGYPVLETIELRVVERFGGDSVPAGDLVADDTGRLYGRITVPAVDPGTYDLEGWTRGIQLSGTEFDVTAGPALSVTPSEGPPGTLASVSFGPTPAGRVTVFYADIPVLGPVQHAGGSFNAEFAVPGDRPVPLGSAVPVRAEVEAGGSIAAAAETDFLSQPAEADEVVVTQFSGPTGPLKPGATFQFSGRVQVPSFRNPTDYEWTAAIRDANGLLVPVDLRPIEMDSFGNFSGEAVTPGLVAGSVQVEFGEVVVGLVYKLPSTGDSGFYEAVVVQYEPFEVQNLRFRVVEEADGTPIPDATVEIYGNVLFVPPDYDYEEDGIPDLRGGNDSRLDKPTWSALYAAPNQYESQVQGIVQTLLPENNSVTGCPITLTSGQTDQNGIFEVNAIPYLNWLLDKSAQQFSGQIDRNTTINGPGKATISINVSALHLALGEWNTLNGKCTGQLFTFQYDYDSDTWNLASEPGGPFDTPFDPSQEFVVEFRDCDQLDIGPTIDPYMPGVPVKEVFEEGERILTYGALWSYPGVASPPLIIEETAQFRLPHLTSLFGPIDNPTMFLNNVQYGVGTAASPLCGGPGTEYVWDLPDLHEFPPGLYEGRIEGTLFSSQPFDERFRLDVRPGPSWIVDQAADFQDTTIRWKPKRVNLFATEFPTDDSVSATPNIDGIGTITNTNNGSAFINQSLLPSGAGSRTRTGTANSSTADSNGPPQDSSASGSGSSTQNVVEFGDDTLVDILNTGKIRLFQYTWGIPPIADASLGADIWFVMQYAYWGKIIMTQAQVLVEATARAFAKAGLDLWFDVSIILDLVNVSAFALPQFSVDMPLEIVNNQFLDPAPCFRFDLDVAWEASVGWCDFCVKAGDTTNLFGVAEGEGCSARTPKRPLQSKSVPIIPAVDRTALAVDGLGRSQMAWGDSSGQLFVQSFANGAPDTLQPLAAGPGAMQPDIAFFDTDRSVLVWTQSSLSEADFLALNDPTPDPNGLIDGDYATAAASQHLVYRVWDGVSWSSTMTLTPPGGGGDGRVVLAACPATDPACPPGGQVLAVWVTDRAGNINLHDTKLRYAFFDGLNWSAIRDVDPGGTAKDVQPTATYMNGQPVVLWIRNTSRTDDGTVASFDLMQRRIAYRFLLEPAGVEVPLELPAGVASPDVRAFDQNTLVVTFSKATEPGAFIGTRRSLHTAYLSQCLAGTCASIGNVVEHTDSQGRRIYVERPQLTRNADGDGVLTFRQLGIDNPSEDDPPGILKNTGALMQLPFKFDPLTPQVVADPIEINTGGAVNWRVDAVFDPSANAVLTSAVQVEQTAGVRRAPVAGVHEYRLRGVGGNGSLIMVERPMRPDFELIDASLDAAWIPEGGTATLTVRLRNNGTDWTEPDALTLATFWNGPPGLGLAGPVRTIDDLVPGQPIDLNVTVPLPAGFNEDDTHTLTVVVNPFGSLDEYDGGNNASDLLVGALPVPEGLRSIDGDASGNIVIHWDPVADPRVTGYRVYRRNPDDSVLHVGWSPVAGFADFSAYPEQAYEYFVTSRTASLTESAPSESVRAWTLDPDRVFKDGFE